MAVIGLVALLRVAAAGAAPLIDDEAYYWLWSRRLDWSYLDHPPMIAYVIFLTTLPGDGEIWLRLGPLLLGVATTYALFLLGREMFDRRAGLLAAALFQIVPVLAGGGLLATPDAPLFLLWVIALRFAWQAATPTPPPDGRLGLWLAAGAAVGLGALSKFYIAFLVVGIGVYLLLHRRSSLAQPGPYLAAGVALVLFLPVIWWNVRHDWAAVGFILHGRPGGTPRGFAGIVELLVQQFAFVLALFPACAWALWGAWRRRADLRFAYLFWTALPALAFALLAAFTTGAPHGNWLGPGYLSLAVVLGALWRRWVGALAALNAVAVAYGFAVLYLPALPLLPGAEEIYGWREAADRVQTERAASRPNTVIVADRYQIAAQIGYYTRDTVPITLLPRPHPASIWPPIETLAGRDALTVIDARWTPVVRWEQCAREAERRAPLDVRARGRTLRTFHVLRLKGLVAGCGEN